MRKKTAEPDFRLRFFFLLTARFFSLYPELVRGARGEAAQTREKGAERVYPVPYHHVCAVSALRHGVFLPAADEIGQHADNGVVPYAL